MDKNILLFDTSYYVFYRYFATLRWYGFQKETPKDLDHSKIHENEEFITAFKKHIDQDFAKLQKKWEIEKSNIIFCADCARADIWRMEIFPDYKGSRKIASTFNGNIFHTFYKYIEDEKYTIISGKHLEADDVVYLIVHTIKELTPKHKQIIIITNDNDYLQIKSTNVEIYNMMGKDIALRTEGKPENDLLKKILIGDVADNIINICPKMGEKTAQKLITMNESEREEWIDSKGCRKQYELNKTLIDFRNIPKQYSDPLVKYLKEEYFKTE
uniref:5'-3' exonuclease alpha-helical arch N-terminal domain-containing protein n=1 Tax=viral metagenome TaxID=1070528 RepID=A0A6C0KSJ8_9ZZZZ